MDTGASRVFDGNTNSQFYMWESQNPHDELDFERDLIASTNENIYQNNLQIRKQPFEKMRDQYEFDRIDREFSFNRGAGRALDESFTSGLELDLELDDLVEEYNERSERE